MQTRSSFALVTVQASGLLSRLPVVALDCCLGTRIHGTLQSSFKFSNWDVPRQICDLCRADFCTMFVQPNRYCGLFRHCGQMKIH